MGSMIGCVPIYMHTVNDAERGLCYVDWAIDEDDDDLMNLYLPKSICNIDMSEKEVIFKTFMAFVVFVVPLSILAFVYFKIHRHAVMSKK